MESHTLHNKFGSNTIHGGNVFIGNQIISHGDDEKQQIQDTIDRLAFPNEHTRYEQITDAYPETFQWIFDPDRSASGIEKETGSSFVKFLQSADENFFWIAGKPGSGKSCLMKFILDNEQLAPCLKPWTNGKPLVLASFFFWRAGSALQNSLLGCLRSLVRQILGQAPGICMPPLKAFPILSSSHWKVKQLRQVLISLVRATEIFYCFIFDGLDEFDGTSTAQDDLLDLLDDLLKHSNVKLCSSSRPDAVFIDKFRAFKSFAMQDLTKTDMHLAGATRLRRSKLWQQYEVTDRGQTACLISDACQKADGVFLWLYLAIEQMSRGLKKNDSLLMLSDRLKALSVDLYELFASLLLRIDSVYNTHTAIMIQYHLEQPAHALQHDSNIRRSPSLLSLRLFVDRISIVLNLTPDVRLISGYTQNTDWIFNELQVFQDAISDRSGGILEVIPNKGCKARSLAECVCLIDGEPAHRPSLARLISHFDHVHVDFLHKSARDFFLEDQRAIAFLSPEVQDASADLTSWMSLTVDRFVLDTAQALESALQYSWFFVNNKRLAQLRDQMLDKICSTAYEIFDDSTVSLKAFEADKRIRRQWQALFSAGRAMLCETSALLSSNAGERDTMKSYQVLAGITRRNVETDFSAFFQLMTTMQQTWAFHGPCISDHDVQSTLAEVLSGHSFLQCLTFSEVNPEHGSRLAITSHGLEFTSRAIWALIELPIDNARHCAGALAAFLRHDVNYDFMHFDTVQVRLSVLKKLRGTRTAWSHSAPCKTNQLIIYLLETYFATTAVQDSASGSTFACDVRNKTSQISNDTKDKMSQWIRSLSMEGFKEVLAPILEVHANQDEFYNRDWPARIFEKIQQISASVPRWQIGGEMQYSRFWQDREPGITPPWYLSIRDTIFEGDDCKLIIKPYAP